MPLVAPGATTHNSVGCWERIIQLIVNTVHVTIYKCMAFVCYSSVNPITLKNINTRTGRDCGTKKNVPRPVFTLEESCQKKKYKRASLNKKKALQSDWITQPRARTVSRARRNNN